LRTCVYLYAAMGLFDDAVELALSGIDSHLAREVCSMPTGQHHNDLRKRLWLRVASWVIAHGSTAQDAISVLHDSRGALRVDDILVFFPDLTLIDDFKDEVTEALKQSDAAISKRNQDMCEYKDAAERVRGDIRALRNRAGVVRLNQKCELCGNPVLSQFFYLFACSHAFHCACLLSEAARHLNSLQRGRLDRQLGVLARINGTLSLLDTSDGGKSGSGGRGGRAALDRSSIAEQLGVAEGAALPVSTADLRTALQSRREDIQAEIDSLVASECLYCGEAMISSVSEPFGVEAGPPTQPTGRLAAVGLGLGSSTLDDDWEI
jgi:vacuolar protein sorting-associated protein 18